MRFNKNVLSALILFGSGLIGVQGQTTGTFTDSRDGNEYKWVQIGEQVWMAQNLAYLLSVNKVADGSEDSKGSYYYVYSYDGTNVTEAKATANYKTYGVLYNWTAAVNGEVSSTTKPEKIQGICPKGWHLPSDEEWTQLADYIKTSSGLPAAGGSLKEKGTIHWRNPNRGANNNIGFVALPGGYRASYGGFSGAGGAGFWWSATYGNANQIWGRSIKHSNAVLGRKTFDKASGFCVRCVRD